MVFAPWIPLGTFSILHNRGTKSVFSLTKFYAFKIKIGRLINTVILMKIPFALYHVSGT